MSEARTFDKLCEAMEGDGKPQASENVVRFVLIRIV
jgi:hypothetical protein